MMWLKLKVDLLWLDLISVKNVSLSRGNSFLWATTPLLCYSIPVAQKNPLVSPFPFALAGNKSGVLLWEKNKAPSRIITLLTPPYFRWTSPPTMFVPQDVCHSEQTHVWSSRIEEDIKTNSMLPADLCPCGLIAMEICLGEHDVIVAEQIR